MKKIYRLQYEAKPGVWGPTGMFVEEMQRVTTNELNPPFKYRAVYNEAYDEPKAI